MTRISLPRGGEGGAPGDVLRTEVRVCASCGYHHDRQTGTDVCESCGTVLDTTWKDLIQLQSVITRRRERISADEEERNRVGFELITTYRFVPRGRHSGRSSGIATATGGSELATITYGDAAEIRVTNLGRRNRKNRDTHGFYLDLIKGQWLSDKDGSSVPEDADDDMEAGLTDVKSKALVTPYVEDRRNIAILRWLEPVTDSEAATLQFAVERGIEATFQLEDSELTSELLPDKEDRGRVLLIEAAEGGAGVLRRVQAEGDALRRVATEALRIIHVDPETGRDTDDACVRGCYRCLLSYNNQMFHELIDRRLITPRLLALAQSTTQPAEPDSDSAKPQPEPPAGLSSRAQALLGVLTSKDLRRPDRYDTEIDGIRVDLAYDHLPVPTAVVLELPDMPRPDISNLLYGGWNVIIVPASDDLAALVAANPGVFGVLS